MKNNAALILCLATVAVCSVSRAGDLKQSKLTQVVNDVRIISAASQSEKNAGVNDVFMMPDILRTGAGSRAELVAEDETVTRVGANTIFSFDPANRTVNLKQGSLLFHSPHGKGGGTIHTGSATASVLGSTLIVTTTGSGGFKVLALEDSAEIKLPNGHKMKLNPGQMTFILPGGNQLSPIIIFRLDSLTQNSLLLKGFGNALPSLNLIQNEVDKQVKLIKSGKVTDTGLFAGDDANANQVEVLDVNSIHHNYNSVKTALLADATINQPSLTDISVPTPPNHVFVSEPFVLEGNSYFGSRTFNGFAARNIYFNTPAVALSPLTVNVGSYGQPEFDFVAANELALLGSVTFSGLSADQKLFLFGGSQISLAAGAVVQANCKDFQLTAPGAFTMNGAQLQNSLGHIGLTFDGDVLAQNGSLLNAGGNLNINSVHNITLDHSTATAGSIFFSTLAGVLTLESSTLTSSGHVIFSTANEIDLKNSTITTGDVVIGGSFVAKVNINSSTITTTAGTLLVSYATDFIVRNSTLESSDKVEIDAAAIDFGSTSVRTHFLTLNSGDGILLDASGKTLTGVGAGSTATFNARGNIDLTHADLGSFANVNLAANTINLTDVAFGGSSAVILRSLNGVLSDNPNTGAVSVPGNVNFISGVTYGGNPAQNYVNNGITITTLH
jgi:hypothetical protein